MIHGETCHLVPDIGKEGVYKGVQPGIIRADRNRVKVAVVTGAGAERDVKVEGRFHYLNFTRRD
jgi:hypothetical protein